MSGYYVASLLFWILTKLPLEMKKDCENRTE